MRVLIVALTCIGLLGCADDTDAVAPIDATVEITATGCRNTLGRGIGTIIAPGLILTSAHTLAGATDITIEHGKSTVDGHLVAFDPEMDLAIVGIDPSTTADVVAITENPLSTVDAPETTGTIIVRRGDRLLTMPATIVRRVEITTDDIYGDTSVKRPGYELRATIEPGDSGALLIVDGEGVAVIWSRSRRTDERAWAIDPVRAGENIRAQLADGIPSTIDRERC